MQTRPSEFPYVYPIKTAQNKCKERYIGFRVISKIPSLFFPNKDVYTLCYAYFRWFDDIVDSLRLHPEESRFIINRQKRFLSELYSEEPPEEISTEELFLAHLVRFDRTQGKNLRQDLENLVGSMEFDADRRGKVISSQELEQYIDDNVIPYVNIASSILNVKDFPKQDLIEIARAGFVVNYLYDLREDLTLGYINISSEEIEQYEIYLENPDSREVQSWIRDKMNSLRDTLFNNPFTDLPLMAKVIAKSMTWKRRKKFRKIESNNYHPII